MLNETDRFVDDYCIKRPLDGDCHGV